VAAPLAEVAAFHHETAVLKQLTPPPIFVQLHEAQPLADGSISRFTMWFGPLPIRWVAVHSAVDPGRGFVDTQVRGPLKSWRHQHSFEAGENGQTVLRERVAYEHRPGLAGVFSRVLFNRPALRLLFAYRKWVTRRALSRPGAGTQG
jgi:ligand-binding SRPBCC domain-containing protein